MSTTYLKSLKANGAVSPTLARVKNQNQTISPAIIFSILAGLILLAGLISLFFLSEQSLRLDEAQSLWQSSHSPLGVLKVIAEDVHVPLYGFLLHFWQLFFGNSVPAARLMSLIFFFAAIPATYFLGKRAFDQKIGLLGAILVAVSPFFNWYGNEIRMYSLLALLGILNQYFFIGLYKMSPQFQRGGNLLSWWGYGITAILGIYTHYFFAFALLTQAIFFFLYRDMFPKHSLRKFIIVAVLVTAAIAPWLMYVRSLDLIGNSTPILTKPTSVNLFNTFSQFVFGFQNDHLNTFIVSLWPLAVLVGFLTLRKHNKVTPTIIYIFLSILLPIILAFLVSVTLVPLFLSRYLILAAAPLYLFLIWGVTNFPSKIATWAKAALVLTMLLSLTAEISSASTPVKEDYKEASQFLTEKVSPQDVIVVTSPFTIYPVQYYYRGSASIITLPIWNRYIVGPIPTFSEEELPAQVDIIKQGHNNIWLLTSYNQGYEDKIKIYFDTHFQRLEEKNFSQGLNLYEYKVNYD